MTAIPRIVGSLVTAIIGNIGKIVMAGVQLLVALIKNLPTIIAQIVRAVPQIISALVRGFTSSIGEMVKVGSNLVKGLQQEQLPAVRKLLEQDLLELDRMQLQMATAREFLIVLRFRPNTTQLEGELIRTEKALKDQGFVARRARAQDLKRLLAVYYEQNVTSEVFEGVDGERWVIFND